MMMDAFSRLELAFRYRVPYLECEHESGPTAVLLRNILVPAMRYYEEREDLVS